MTIELPEKLESALAQQALVRGVSPDFYVRELLERDLEASDSASKLPFKSSYGLLAKYGPAPSAEEIDENRRDMLRGSIFAEDAS